MLPLLLMLALGLLLRNSITRPLSQALKLANEIANVTIEENKATAFEFLSFFMIKQSKTLMLL